MQITHPERALTKQKKQTNKMKQNQSVNKEITAHITIVHKINTSETRYFSRVTLKFVIFLSALFLDSHCT